MIEKCLFCDTRLYIHDPSLELVCRNDECVEYFNQEGNYNKKLSKKQKERLL